MERLVTTSEAAQILGLSLQGVHYRIKSGQLKSLKQGGKTFVYMTEFLQEEFNKDKEKIEKKHDAVSEVIKAKDDQISLLKQSIAFIKEQYDSEIKRLEKNQKRIIKVFNSEITLLQSAFNEMRTLYKPKLQPLKVLEEAISITEFSLKMKRHHKTDEEIKAIIVKGIKRNDPRFIYNKQTKKVIILNADYSDLI